MEKHKPSRWFALIMVLINIVFNYYSDAFSPDGRTIRDISDQYPNLFMPAPYTFAIWGLIYLSVLIYAVVQVLPKPKHVNAYNELTFPLAFISLLGMCWILSFLNDFILISEIIILGMLATSAYAFVQAKSFAKSHKIGLWAVVPFSMYVGWLSVASLASTNAWLVSEGWYGGALGQTNFAVVLLFIAILAGVFVSFKFHDIVYPLVITWGIVGIWANWSSNGIVSTVAITGGVALVVVALINSMRNDFIRYTHDPHRRRRALDNA